MRLLLDTSALLWWVLGDDRLSKAARQAIISGDAILVSAVTAMELSTKLRIGKLPQARLLVDEYARRLEDEGFAALLLTSEHALHAGLLPGEHRDPFDRMLAAQAICERLMIVSGDEAFDGLGAKRLW